MSEEKSAVKLEIPGFKLEVTSAWVALSVTVLLLAAIVYLVAERSESVSTVISSISPPSSASKTREGDVLRVWVPDGPKYIEKSGEFEKWLSKNSGWWGKLRLSNRLFIKGESVVLDGFEYSAEPPFPENPQHKVLKEAIRIFEITDLDLIWVELQARRFR